MAVMMAARMAYWKVVELVDVTERYWVALWVVLMAVMRAAMKVCQRVAELVAL